MDGMVTLCFHLVSHVGNAEVVADTFNKQRATHIVAHVASVGVRATVVRTLRCLTFDDYSESFAHVLSLSCCVSIRSQPTHCTDLTVFLAVLLLLFEFTLFRLLKLGIIVLGVCDVFEE